MKKSEISKIYTNIFIIHIVMYSTYMINLKSNNNNNIQYNINNSISKDTMSKTKSIYTNLIEKSNKNLKSFTIKSFNKAGNIIC